jgi:ubiquinone/menaquinone biosynthesis C-methylase UbiE
MTEKEKYWSRFANDFEERNNYVVGKSDMKMMLNEVSEQKDLKNTLELGCGNGTYSKVVSKNADRLLTTDFSDEMVSAAKNKLQSFSNIKVEKADCFNLQYPDNSFDTVFMANLLQIIPNPESVITESKRVLKKGGKIIIVSFTLEGMSFFNFIKMLYRYFKTYGKPVTNGRKLTVKNTSEMLRDNGFEIEEAKLVGDKMKAVFVTAIKM